MATDYFTRAEFRTFADDPSPTDPAGGEKYSDADIDRAQAEVIEALEAWARSSWANVTGTAGNGTAADYRLAEETFDGGDARYLLGRIPIESIESIEFDEEVLEADDYALYTGPGEIRFASETGAGNRLLVVEYRYGHGTCPWSIKRPAMQATKALLDGDEGEGGIPPNVTEYNTEGTTFLMQGEDNDDIPWPWERTASRDVAAIWGPSRPSMTGARV